MSHFRIIFAVAALIVVATAVPAAARKDVRLRAIPPLKKGLARFPRIVAGATPEAMKRINHSLATADAIGCGKGEWTRTIDVPMRGPDYLSLVASDDYYCGGAYPDTDTQPLTFDLKSGALIDWAATTHGLIEASAAPASNDRRTVESSVLWKAYVKAVSPSVPKACAAVFADPESAGTKLMLWPDARADGVELMAADFPHVIKACGPPAAISTAQARTLGFAAELTAAVDQAHRLSLYGAAAP